MAYVTPLIVEVGRNLMDSGIRMGKEEYHEIDQVSTYNLRLRMIADTMTMWEKAARPTIEGCLRSCGVFPIIPLHKLLLTVPDRVTGGASSAGMWLHAPRLRQLAR